MNRKIRVAVIIAVAAIIVVGIIAYGTLGDNSPTTVTVTYYKMYLAGNTGAPQQQLPDTVVQFMAVFKVNSGFFYFREKQAQLNFDDFYLTSNGQPLAPLQGYSEIMSHGNFTLTSGRMYAWDARFVVEKGVTSCQLEYGGTGNVNIVYVDTEYPYAGSQLTPLN